MTLSVLLVSHGFQPSYEKGFANGLAENGIRVELVASDRTLTEQIHHDIIVRNLRGSQDPGRPRLEKARNLIRYVFVLLRRIRKGRHDVVHLTGLFLTRNQTAGLIEWLAYRFWARCFFMTVHNLLPHNRHTWYNAMLYRILYRIPDRLVVHTEKMKSGLIHRFGVPAHRVIVMQHGVDDLPVRLNLSAPSRVLRVLLFGSLSPYKGADLLLEALQYCKAMPVEVVIAGECRDKAYAIQIEKYLNALSPQHKVRWDRGFVDEEKVGAYFEAADVTLLPYRHIDQSGVLFTAFRYGSPVIATDVGSFREYLPAFAGCIVDELSPKAIAENLIAFNAEKDRYDRARIRELAESMIWPRTVSVLIEAYTHVCRDE